MKRCHSDFHIFLTTSPGKINLVMPIKTVNEFKMNEHWAQKSKRHSIQKGIVRYYFYMLDEMPKPPCHIIFTRISPKKLDYQDNLRSSMKWIVDAVCDQLIPGLKPGMADGDNRLSFEYRQEKGEPKEYSVRVEIIEKS